MALANAIDPGPLYGRRPAQSPDALVRAHMALVRKIAWHVHGRVASAIEIEDLVQIGMVALVEAAKGFEDRGHAFATYATLRIRGAMIDHLRRHALICRSAMARRRELADVRHRLEGRFGRAPTEDEMAAEMGLDAADYRALVDDSQAVHQESIDEVYSDHSMWFADVEERADDRIDRERLKQAIANGIRQLPERDAMVLQLYFVEEMNLDEIGQTLGVGAARICQIKKAALDKLRGALSGWDE
ncbi:FliA/WhiG family RNA polymerase sigma factor [Sphingosinicella ginsenosidimutans]|jgi:RNA polymerase sigma factor for flagellar operon FliA|uniref:FliA/WhiG family RNA polymerase sigma factor n=1 Tax=Allosphingosinicella ginsenosidimutans TaxID=1176539 RepID=A0A5C6TTU7_9SPHN|nr:FliA/WhiG family RNA polymerase sigma factor [Sphingosinicella ginsenosidimutans]TXC63802.1 FliA/WhiG family RNA polymerase sigma factor [Sphingosinicella ginsenosidimutans]